MRTSNGSAYGWYNSPPLDLKDHRSKIGRGKGATHSTGSTSSPQAGSGQANLDENKIYFYHGDHLGSASYITDTLGDVYEHMLYLPYGETWVDEGSNTHLLGYRFTGKEEDSETKLIYFGARYYDARVSGWISTDDRFDGLYDSKALNLYMYVKGNPVTYTDPDGHVCVLGVQLCTDANPLAKGSTPGFTGFQTGTPNLKAMMEAELPTSKKNYNSYFSVLGFKIPIPGSAIVNETKEMISSVSQKIDNIKNTYKQITNGLSSVARLYDDAVKIGDGINALTDTLSTVGRVTAAVLTAQVQQFPSFVSPRRQQQKQFYQNQKKSRWFDEKLFSDNCGVCYRCLLNSIRGN